MSCATSARRCRACRLVAGAIVDESAGARPQSTSARARRHCSRQSPRSQHASIAGGRQWLQEPSSGSATTRASGSSRLTINRATYSCTTARSPATAIARSAKAQGSPTTPKPTRGDRGRSTSKSPSAHFSIVSDSHINILRQVAGRLQRALDQHDALDRTAELGSAPRRQQLERLANRARTRVAEAEARRLNRHNPRLSENTQASRL